MTIKRRRVLPKIHWAARLYVEGFPFAPRAYAGGFDHGTGGPFIHYKIPAEFSAGELWERATLGKWQRPPYVRRLCSGGLEPQVDCGDLVFADASDVCVGCVATVAEFQRRAAIIDLSSWGATPWENSRCDDRAREHRKAAARERKRVYDRKRRAKS